jgi:hypothetical protein
VHSNENHTTNNTLHCVWPAIFLTMNYQTNLALKRLLSIFFLTIFLFNVGGYYVVFWGLQYQADKVVQKQLDNGTYAGSDEVTLSVPLTLPYPISEEGFTRVNGSFEYQGTQYKLVKQKIENDKLIVVCIKDEKSTNLNNTLSNVAKAAHNQKSSKDAMSLLAKLIKEFQSEEMVLFGMTLGWSRDINKIELNLSYQAASQPINIPPPRVS